MWCRKCHYGSDAFVLKVGIDCPQCGSKEVPLKRNPFPAFPKGMGRGGHPPKKQQEEAKSVDEQPKQPPKETVEEVRAREAKQRKVNYEKEVLSK